MIDLSHLTDAQARKAINELKPDRYMAPLPDGAAVCATNESGPFFTVCTLQLVRMPDGSVRQMMLRLPSERN